MVNTIMTYFMGRQPEVDLALCTRRARAVGKLDPRSTAARSKQAGSIQDKHSISQDIWQMPSFLAQSGSDVWDVLAGEAVRAARKICTFLIGLLMRNNIGCGYQYRSKINCSY